MIATIGDPVRCRHNCDKPNITRSALRITHPHLGDSFYPPRYVDTPPLSSGSFINVGDVQYKNSTIRSRSHSFCQLRPSSAYLCLILRGLTLRSDPISLVIGGSGFLGQYLVHALATQFPDQTVLTLARGQYPATKDSQEVSYNSTLAAQKSIVRGDVRCSNLGLQNRYYELCDQVTDVFHLAANTQFSADKVAIHQINVEGTKNVISFVHDANKRKRLGCRLHFVSTAYICGRYSGIFYENDFAKGQSHNNDYEKSKFLAESLVRRAASDIPATIYRPSIIVGDSSNGWSNKFAGFYDVVNWLRKGWLKSFPAPPDAQLDIIAVDYVAAAIASLSCRPASDLMSYALVSGADLAPDISTVVRSTEGVLMRHGANIRELDFTPLRPQPAQSRTELLQQVVTNPRIVRPLSFLLPYIEGATRFDARCARHKLRLSGLKTPNPEAYIDKIVDYAVGCNFGRSKRVRESVGFTTSGQSRCDMFA